MKLSLCALVFALVVTAHADDTTLTLPQCLDAALKKNPTILKAQAELRRTHGVIVETRGQAIPNIAIAGEFRERDPHSLDTFPGTPSAFNNQQEPWLADVEVTQLLFSGGRVHAALRAATLGDQIAVLNYTATVADIIRDVRKTFYEILLNTELITVREQSLTLLEQQLTDARHRFEVGAVPQFTVLRAEVEFANAKPPLIRARNNLRLTKAALARLVAWGDFTAADEQPHIQFAGALTYEPRDWQLTDAIQRALSQRAELQQAEKRVALQHQNIIVARSGYFPELTAFGGYGIRNSTFSDHVDETVNGWTAGARARWDIFDGAATHGKIQQARAGHEKAELDLDDTRRAIELEVRTAYSDYQQALELLDAQKKTVEQGAESLRLAEARFRAGTGAQLDVLSAQTALTQARSDEIQALYDYNVALANLDRATGTTVKVE